MEFVKAFVVGGFICAIGQVLIDRTKMTPARILALGIYEPIVEFAGAGATVPLTGFGYTMAKGTLEFINKKGAIGILTGGLSSASAGITAAVFFGYLAALVSKPGDKN